MGDSVSFTATASGTAPLSYAWYKTGNATVLGTGASYTISSVVVADAGSYYVVVTNSCPPGTATSNAATLTVNKAAATVTLSDLTQTYTGSPLYPTASTDPLGLTIVWTNAPQTDVGSYAVTATVDDPNYEGSASDTFVIDPADATCTISGYSGVYDAAFHGASGSCAGIGGEDAGTLDLPTTTFRNVPGGSVHWTFTGNGNYKDQSGDAAIEISQADATCSISGYNDVYDAASHGATGSCAGVGGEAAGTLDLGDSFTNVPGGTASWTFTGNGNYNDQSGDVAIVITKADADCTVTPYSVIYDGNAHTATGSCTGVGGATLSGLNLSGTTHTSPGDYPADPWTFTDVTGNYNNTSGTVHDNIHYATGGTCYGGPGHSILQPINSDGTSVFKQKSTVPAKFRVCDASGNSIGTPGVVTGFVLYQIVNGGVTSVNEVVDSTATPYTEFRWSPDGQQWIFNISTKDLKADKSYFYRITLNDNSIIEFSYKLK